MNYEEEILEYIYEIVEHPDLKCKAKLEYIEEVLNDYFGKDEDDEPDFDKVYNYAISHC